MVAIVRPEASAKKLFHHRSPWEILLSAARDSTPRYEKYSHADRADVYRVHLSSEIAASLMKQTLDISPRGLRQKLARLPPPAAILFFIPRANSVRAGAPPSYRDRDDFSFDSLRQQLLVS